MRTTSSFGFLLLVCVITPAAFSQNASRCDAVYSNAVRNIDVVTRSRFERRTVFDLHCEQTGQLKKSSESLDLTIPIKKIELGFSGTRDQAKSLMSEFCKTYSESSQMEDSFYEYNNRVVQGALDSFNRCVALEREDVLVEHEVAGPTGVVVRFDFDPTRERVRLNNVLFRSGSAKCTSDIGSGSTRIDVGPTMRPVSAESAFSISCERNGKVDDTKGIAFERLDLLVDTNQGAYSVSLPDETILGYEFASEAREKDFVRTSQVNALTEEANALRARTDTLARAIAGMSVTLHTVTQGEKRGAPVGCYGDVGMHQRSVCAPGKIVQSAVVHTIGGDRCGYTTHAFVCLKYPDANDAAPSDLVRQVLSSNPLTK